MDTPLLTTVELERLHRRTLDWRARRPAASPQTGTALSFLRGRGMEAHDVRAYHPGDDVRHMDWRATARAGRPITKLFREERQRLLYLVIDRGPAMRFGTRSELKAATAARAAAILAYSALARGGRVAGLLLEPDNAQDFPPQHLDGTLRLLHAAAAPIPLRNGATALADTLKKLDRGLPRGATLCLVSDFHTLDESAHPQLRQLAERHDVIAVQVLDPSEEELPRAGRVRLVSPVDGTLSLIDTADESLRQRYAQTMRARHDALAALFRSTGITHIRVRTGEDVFHALSGALRT